MRLVEDVYTLTQSLPDEEKFGLVSQIRRSAISIPSNIAEGYRRHSKPDFARFLQIALGSLNELQTQLEICDRLGYVKTEEIIRKADEVGKILYGLTQKNRNVSKE